MRKLFIFLFFCLMGLMGFAQESESDSDLAKKTGNNPIIAQSRVDIGYSYVAFDAQYNTMYHDFRIAFNYAVTNRFQVGMEIPVIGFSAPNAFLDKTKITAGDFKVKSLYVPYMSKFSAVGDSTMASWGVITGLDVTLPTGKKEYGTGGNKYLFDPILAIGGVFNTKQAGSMVLAGMFRYGGSISVDNAQMMDNYLLNRLMFTHILPTGTFYTVQLNYVADFLTVSRNQGYRQQFFAKLVLGQMFSRKVGMSLEFTQHVAGDYLAAQFSTLQIMLRYII